MKIVLAAVATTAAITAALLLPASAYADPVDDAWQAQRANALPRTSFYDPPSPLTWAPGGTVIRTEQTAEYAIGAATRVLYHSRTSGGRDVAASGVVLTPPGVAPSGGWPVVLYAHGASGIARDCAPSLMRDLYHGDQVEKFLDAGYAVVAPDYAGLGTTGRPELVNKTAEADDLRYALRAAYALRTDLSPKWTMWAHSQGGGAALGLAEQLVWAPEPGYLGAVITSPAADLPTLFDHVVSTPGYGAFGALLPAGAKYSDPSIRLDRILTTEALNRLPITGSGCLGVASAAYADLTGAALVRSGSNDAHFTRYLRVNSTGTLPVAGPLLLVQGDADTVTPRAVTDGVAAGLCRTGARLDYRVYSGLEHDSYPQWGVVGIDDGAMPDILAWTGDRFAGKPTTTTC
ncbi:alpha/beta fold hydrolase [Hamadaea sp. NPDC051192]|uniref:alpha/beta fold hydrolase n=1 Tax=Hamadaea sp. NPDC051192 TaxID=3154940 RepID=UPI0034450F2D